MAKAKRSDISPMIGSQSTIKPNKTIGDTTGGSKVGKKPRKSKGGKRTLNTLGGKSGIMNPPSGGGY